MDKIKVYLYFIVVLSFLGGVPRIVLAQHVNALPIEDVLRRRSFANLSSIEVSPDGRWLAYVVEGREIPKPNKQGEAPLSEDSGYVSSKDVWLLNVDTGEIKNVSNGGGKSSSPKWSPDGQLLAFVSDRNGGGQARLWIWDAMKGDLKKVSDIDVSTRVPSVEWTPDSRSVFIAATLEDVTSRVSEERNQFDTNNQKIVGEKARGPAVHVYESSADRVGDNESLRSDPWNLDIWLRDLVKVDVVTGHAKVIVHQQRITTYRLAPDGSRIVYSIANRFKKPGQTILYDLATVTIATNQERMIASGVRIDNWGTAFSWSPDSTLISYYASDLEDKGTTHDCYIVSAAGGPPRNLTKFPPFQHESQLPAYSSVPLWDRSGNFIYFVDDGALWRASISQDSASQIARIPNHRIKALLISQLGDLLWTLDGGRSTVVVAHDDVGFDDGFYRINLTNGESVKLLEDGQCYSCVNSYQQVVPTHGGQQLAYFAEDAQRPSDLWLSDVAFKSPRRLTHLNPQLDMYKLGAARLIDWLSDDGERLHGALLLPSDYCEGKRYPLVVEVYGGGVLSNAFDHFGLNYSTALEPQLLATRGYAVLLPDSPSHEGTPMADLAKTVLPGVNKVIEMGIGDPERLGVAGQSNGGYSTLALIVQTRRFKAAIDVDGMADLTGMYGEMREDGTAFATVALERHYDVMGGTPWQFRERYIENSPFFYLDRVETPLLIVHVAGDPVVASFLGDQVFVALRRLGKEVEYAKYDGEGHGPEGFANEMDHRSRMITWLDKYLKAAPSKAVSEASP